MNGFPVVAPSDCQPDASAGRVEVRLSGWGRPGIQCDDAVVTFFLSPQKQAAEIGEITAKYPLQNHKKVFCHLPPS